MIDLTEQRERQIQAFQSHLDPMVTRRRKERKNDDCFIVFNENAPEGLDTRAAAEDIAFIWYSLWKFPMDWQFYYKAAKFSGKKPRDWEGDGIVSRQ